MSKLGWSEGSDFVLQSGVEYGVSSTELEDAVKRIVADKPDLVFTQTTAYAVAMHRGTTSIPIVMATSGYPVEAGLAHSLARPGKNVTGNAAYAGQGVWSKLVQLLRETRPNVYRVGVLWTYVPPAFPREEVDQSLAELRVAERSLGVKLHIVEAAHGERIAEALTVIAAGRPDALLVTSALALAPRASLTQFALDNGLPMITDTIWPVNIDPYPLLSYGAQFEELVRSSVSYVDRIIRGAAPGDLPIQQPAKFRLVVSLKTARTMGLTVLPTLLARADEVIE